MALVRCRDMTTMTMVTLPMIMAMITRRMITITITITITIITGTTTATITSMTDRPLSDPAQPSGDALVKLMTWLSPAFPVGSFTYSHGLEWAIEDRTVTDLGTLKTWISGILSHGAGRSDAILLAHAWRSAAGGDQAGLRDIAELAFALQPSKERRLEAGAQGKAFVAAISATWEAPALASLARDLAPTPVAYAVALGTAGADHGLPLNILVEAFLTAFVANLVSAAVRAVPLGQTDGQRAIRDLAPLAAAMAAEALAADLDDIGGAALRSDIASMKHETQYTRLFRS